MAKRKHYVYLLTSTKEVAKDLQSAIALAMYDMYNKEREKIDREVFFDNHTPEPQLTAPIVSKVFGGYQVVAVGYDGTIRKRRIDVFEPYKQPQGCKRYKVDRAYAMQYRLD